MKKNTSAWIRLIISSCLLLCFTGILLIGIVGKGISFPLSFHFSSGNSYRDAEKYSVGNASLSVASLRNLDIDWYGGQIKVTPYDGTTLEILEQSSDSLDDDDKVHYYYNNDKLSIKYRASEFFFSFGIRNDEKKLELKIPRNLLKDLNTLDIDVTSADVFLSDLTAPRVNIDTVSGAITATNVTFNDLLNIDGVSGDCKLEGDFSQIKSDTVSGQIEVNSRTTPKSLDLESVSGDFSLTIPSDSNFTAEHDSASGDFNCDFTTTTHGDEKICGDGSNEYSFDTVSGNVEIHKALS